MLYETTGGFIINLAKTYLIEKSAEMIRGKTEWCINYHFSMPSTKVDRDDNRYVEYFDTEKERDIAFYKLIELVKVQ